ncbi:MAG TPA: hypothetical protein VLJ59_18655 [Mycobacteriales bacterium]|nr:hypothetical protein [Mycobacteriales bacterium]
MTAVETAPSAPAPEAGGLGRPRWAGLASVLRLAGAHRWFGLALAAGLVVRAVAVLGYWPALWFNDSFEYVGVALRLQPYPIRPDGYSFYLRALEPLHSFRLVVITQHLMGLGVAVLLYALLRRWGVPGWLATLGSLPQLLDVHQVQLESLILSDTLFTALLVAAVTLLGWRARPSWRLAGAAGLLLALATLTRSVGLPLLLLAGLYLLVRRPGWRAAAAFGVLAAAPVAGYATWYHSVHGQYALSSSEGIFLYSRVMQFADCATIHPPADLAGLCDPRPPADREPSSNYIWRSSPLDRVTGSYSPVDGAPPQRFTPRANEAARQFAVRAILAQPGDYLRLVGRDLLRGLAWEREPFPNAGVLAGYEFTLEPKKTTMGLSDGPGRPERQVDRVFVPGGTARGDTAAYEANPADTAVVQPFADMIIGYQRVAFLPGPVLAAVVLLGLAGVLAARRRDPRRWPALLLWGVSAALLVLPPATAQFDYRYLLPAVPLAAAAAALAGPMLRRRG